MVTYTCVTQTSIHKQYETYFKISSKGINMIDVRV